MALVDRNFPPFSVSAHDIGLGAQGVARNGNGGSGFLQYETLLSQSPKKRKDPFCIYIYIYIHTRKGLYALETHKGT